MTLLDAAAHDERLAWELVQNVHSPAIRDKFQSELGRKLFNHLASALGLVDHVRRIASAIPLDIRTEFAKRTTEMSAHAEVGFMQNLRNYTLHRSLPLLGHSMRIDNVNTSSQTFESEIELSVVDLLAWDGWKAGSRRYLEGVGERLLLRALVRHHGELVDEHNRWLADQMARRVNASIDEVNELILDHEVARFGMPRDVVRDLIDKRSARNSIPPPDRWIGSQT